MQSNTQTHASNSNKKSVITQVFNCNYYPWIVITMSCLFLFYKYIVQVSPSVMTGELMHHFTIHATGLSELVASYFPVYLIAQFLVGPLLDRYSTRLLSFFALLLMSVSLFEFSNATEIWQAYVWRSLMGVGAAFATVSYLKLAAVWFEPRKFSFVAGWLATAASVGGMIAQTPIAVSVQHVGWQHTLYLCSLIGVAVAFIYLVLVRSINPANKTLASNATNKPNIKQLKQLITSKKVWLLALYNSQC